MKKIILTALAVVSFTLASAQEENGSGFAKGDVFISGGFGFGSEKTGDDKTNTFNISPRVGFFVSENIAAGARINFSSEKREFGTNEETYSTTSLGAFGRYYISPASKFSLFGELGVDYIASKFKEEGEPDDKSNGFGFGFAPGVSYFISNNFALEATWGILGYRTVKPDVDNAESTNNFDFGVDLQNINLGLVYKF
ncbi:porin family protein [Aquimarina muelleri]|uniref:Flavo-specific protein antigen FspA n=1 Tax=Aquimarina muelleri TaxID=279356 RepID=A0A918JQW8_9FLAO|nr:porin family protein [Aquimarina muelleri]MCX2763035.1 porin family protein [Aquimarina muelleri]GGX03289.1 flavo-specific protein antigen FspA [Aquimarina muelleri]